MSYNPKNPFPPLSDRNERTIRAMPVGRTRMTVTVDLAWSKGAVCEGLDPDTMFPESGGELARARKLCASCPVKDACLADALKDGTREGVWGGTTRDERTLLRRVAYDHARYRNRRSA